MIYMSSEDAALLIATMLHRSGKTRARISDQTLKVISKRKRLKTAFRTEVVEWAEEFGVIMYPLDRGGYGLLSASSMEGAPPLRSGAYISAELSAYKKTGTIDHNALYVELGFEVEEEDDD